jgi:hypothetical protein
MTCLPPIYSTMALSPVASDIDQMERGQPCLSGHCIGNDGERLAAKRVDPGSSFDECFRMVHAQNPALFKPATDSDRFLDRCDALDKKLLAALGGGASGKANAVKVIGTRPQENYPS